MTLLRKKNAVYAEESVFGPALLALTLSLLVAALLVYRIVRLNQHGKRHTNFAAYHQLVQAMRIDVSEVDAIMRNDTEALSALAALRRPELPLIFPEEVVDDQEKSAESKEPEPFHGEISGIYWNPTRPLVGIDGETYGVGDRVGGYEIVRIGKSMVQLQSEDGTLVVRDINEDLRKFK